MAGSGAMSLHAHEASEGFRASGPGIAPELSFLLERGAAFVIRDLDLDAAQRRQASPIEMLQGAASFIPFEVAPGEVQTPGQVSLFSKIENTFGLRGAPPLLVAANPLLRNVLDHVLRTLLPNSPEVLETLPEDLSRDMYGAVFEVSLAGGDCYENAAKCREREVPYLMFPGNVPYLVQYLKWLAPLMQQEARGSAVSPETAKYATCFSAHNTRDPEPLLVVDPEILDSAAGRASERVVRPSGTASIWDSGNGFLRSLTSGDFEAYMMSPGARLSVALRQKDLLGYVLCSIDASLSVDRARLLQKALSSAGVEVPLNPAYAHLIEVTPAGSDYGRRNKSSVYESLMKMLVDEARAAGAGAVIAECRGLPYPNENALRKHLQHGWELTGASLLSPYGEQDGKAIYTLSHILIYDLTSASVGSTL